MRTRAAKVAALARCTELALAACCFWVTLLGSVPDGIAQQTDDERARAHFTAGRSYLDQARYDDAAWQFEEAYRLSQRPEMLVGGPGGAGGVGVRDPRGGRGSDGGAGGAGGQGGVGGCGGGGGGGPSIGILHSVGVLNGVSSSTYEIGSGGAGGGSCAAGEAGLSDEEYAGAGTQ